MENNSLYKAFGTDKNLENGAGVILDYGELGRVKIHRAGGANKRFNTFLAAKTKPYRRQIEADLMPADKATQIMAEVYAETVIIGWENVKDENGKDLPFTKENVVKLLTEIPDFFYEIKTAANDAATFRREELREDIKNSEPVSAGS